MSHIDDLLPRAIARHADATPDRPFATEVTGRTQTYAEADIAGAEFARALVGLGVNAGDKVLVFMPTCIDTLNIWTGLGRLGAIQVPINTNFDGQMLQYVINTSQATIAICASRWLERVTRLAPDLAHLTKIVVIDEDEVDDADGPTLISRRSFFAGLIHEAPLHQPELHDPAMMMFTSGTTGPSKAAILPWGAFAQASYNVTPPPGPQALTAEDVFYLPFPLFHTSGTQWSSAIVRLGGHIVLREVFSTTDFWSDVRQHGCTATMLLGAMAGFLLKEPPSPNSAENPLRVVAVVPMIEGISELQERFGLSTYTLYGSTELGLVIGSDLNEVLAPGSCGRLRPGYEARIVDQHDLEMPEGQAGELVIRPSEPWTTFIEYLGMPAETVKAFSNLWFHTGDGFRRQADGQLVFVDRIKDAIRRRGENISSAEVESAVIAHDDVLECAAVAVPAEFGEDEVKICVVVRAGSGLTPIAITEFLIESRLPRFMLPKYIEVLDELPRTPTSKVRKDVLRSAGITEATWTRPETRARR